jgi:hypothetical protein
MSDASTKPVPAKEAIKKLTSIEALQMVATVVASLQAASQLPTDREIALCLAGQLLQQCERKYSPRIMYSLLHDYCRGDIAQQFLAFYTRHEPLDIAEPWVGVWIDITDAGQMAAALGWRANWLPVCDEYKAAWLSGFGEVN